MFKKENRLNLILSSLAILLPMAAGLIFWDRLPDILPRHWDIYGQPDGYSSKGFVIFVLPLIMLAAHWLCILVTAADRKNRGQNKKVYNMILWIMPLLTNTLAVFLYAVNSGREPSMSITLIIIALMFIIIGNYLPKCRQNYTIGIRIKWTLANEENWNATHRFAGRVWVIGGVLLLLCALLPEKYAMAAMFVSIIPLAVIPTVYSWLYYKKQADAGRAPAKAQVPMSKTGRIISIVILSLVLILVLIVLFGGSISFVYDENALTIDATLWSDIRLEYDEIDSIEYLSDGVAGRRINGFGSGKLLMGLFRNDELGTYTRYSYTRCDSAILINCGGDWLVLSGEDDAETKSIYNELLSRTE
ncbi:MAG: SdpI family protein [Oscillospiraceae bacterium]|nr:SdpI family protein [Oscillospiraceae bacterium]